MNAGGRVGGRVCVRVDSTGTSDAIERLRAAHPDHADRIDGWAAQAHGRLDGARVQTFLPILLERDVRRRLTDHLAVETDTWGGAVTPTTLPASTTSNTTEKENAMLKGFKDFLRAATSSSSPSPSAPHSPLSSSR